MIWLVSLTAIVALAVGHILGERHQRRIRDHEKEELAHKLRVTDLLLQRSRQMLSEKAEDLHVANLRVLHLQQSNHHFTRQLFVLGHAFNPERKS